MYTVNRYCNWLLCIPDGHVCNVPDIGICQDSQWGAWFYYRHHNSHNHMWGVFYNVLVRSIFHSSIHQTLVIFTLENVLLLILFNICCIYCGFRSCSNPLSAGIESISNISHCLSHDQARNDSSKSPTSSQEKKTHSPQWSLLLTNCWTA